MGFTDPTTRARRGGSGLREGWQIPAIAVDPAIPKRVFVAVLAHPYGPNRERGVYRSRDGGRIVGACCTDDDTGAMVVLDPANAGRTPRCGPRGRRRENGWSIADRNAYKSSDGGTTWRRIAGRLPGAGEASAASGFRDVRE